MHLFLGIYDLLAFSQMLYYAGLNFSFGCLQRGQRQSSGRSSKATPSCSAGSFRYLLRLVAERLEGIHIAADVLAGKDGRILIGHFFGKACRQVGVYQNHFAARVNQIVLNTFSFIMFNLSCITSA